MAKKEVLQRMKSGVMGFDLMCDGGFERGSNVILSGTPGTGKTTFGMQFLVEGAKNGEKGLYISLSESVEKIVLHSQQFGWPLPELIKQKNLMVAMYPFQFIQQSEGGAANINRLVDQIKYLMDQAGGNITRLVLDSVSLLTYRYESVQAQRNELDYLFKFLALQNITSLFILERSQWNNVFSFEDFLADSVVVLQDVLKDFDRKRGLTIIKMRGAKIDRSVRPYVLGADGIEVYPDGQLL